MQSLCASVLDILNNALASLMLGKSLLNAKYVESKVHLKPKQVQTWATHRDFRSACSLSLWGVVCVSNEENKQAGAWGKLVSTIEITIVIYSRSGLDSLLSNVQCVVRRRIIYDRSDSPGSVITWLTSSYHTLPPNIWSPQRLRWQLYEAHPRQIVKIVNRGKEWARMWFFCPSPSLVITNKNTLECDS